MSGSRPTGRPDATAGPDDGVVIPRTTALGERSPTAETALVAIGFFLIQFPLTLVGLVGLFALSPAVIVEPWTLLTATYSHGSPGHLIGNLLGLVVFGALVERVSSRLRFHAFFVTTGALAGLVEVAVGSLLTLSPRGVLGASGAVFALMGYVITGNGLAGRLLDALDRTTTASWTVTAVLVGLAAVLAVVLSAPGTALFGHAAGLALGLLAGRARLLHVRRGRSRRG
jgi:membrane associated rhomboid family serine protease